MTQEVETERPILTTVEDLEALNHGAVLIIREDFAAISSWDGVQMTGETLWKQYWLVTGDEEWYTAKDLIRRHGEYITLLFNPDTDRIRG